MTTLLQLLPVSLALLPVASNAADTQIAFSPEKGSRWTKTFTHESSLSGGDLSVVMDGQDIPEEFLPVLEFELESKSVVTVTDHYLELGEGRPLKLRRTYDDAHAYYDESLDAGGFEGMEDGESSTQGASPLEGLTVEFAWDAESEAYETEWHGEEGDPALLDGLDEDMDLRGFLPGEDVSVGDSWTVQGGAFAPIFFAGGDLAHDFEGESASRYEREDAEFEIEGEAELELTGVHDQDGVRIAVMKIEGTILARVKSATDLEDIPVVDGTGVETTENEYELEGELSWDLTHGILRSLELEAECEMTVITVRDADQPGPTFESTITFSGKTEFKIDVKPAE